MANRNWQWNYQKGFSSILILKRVQSICLDNGYSFFKQFDRDANIKGHSYLFNRLFGWLSKSGTFDE